MKERVSSATEAFKQASGSETHLFIFFTILMMIFIIVVGGIFIFTHKERREKFKRFFSRLKKANVSQNDGKKLFTHMDKKYKGNHFLFFQEEAIAQKAIKSTGVKGNFGIFFPSLKRDLKDLEHKDIDPVLKNRKSS